MDRAERTSLGVAVIGHVALFGLLSVGFSPNDALRQQPEAMEVTLSDEVALESSSPTPEAQPPAAQSPDPADMDTPEAPTPQPMPQVQPTPQPRVQPQPQRQPAPSPQPRPKPTPAKPAPAAAKPAKPAPAKQPPKQRGTLGDLTKGLSDKPRPSTQTGAPAATLGAAEKSSLARELLRQIKPHWQRYAPTGPDVELLRTVVQARLARDGSIIGEPRVISHTGVNATNRSQSERHQEMAIKAVKLAAPFKFPAEFYDGWKVITPALDRKLQ